ncbi:hypothetical protein EI546_07980 [Aequorivita sp. H23M31]|uniref:Uncharacterized protein n=1 Tax=Aequorivita ciconiae TaxID=2494375 RepID=A0A410G311_9FLAO|nr:hypothetical protein [Aequorivita sp. H23M31]QAA81667.1 hypothetical protein EI546_07980 [Aequorivita sp. H23M31]
MNWKWYILGLFTVLVFYGAGTEQTILNSNQEIVVRFNAHSISSEQVDIAISEITSQLEAIGVEHVQVSDLIDGKLKVSYYSALEVGVIKSLLYRQNKIDLGNSAFNEKNNIPEVPYGNNSKQYQLEVVKIHTDSGSGVGFQGVLVEAKFFGDQYLKPRFALVSSEIIYVPRDNFENINPVIYASLPGLITHLDYKVPQVRAGPYC